MKKYLFLFGLVSIMLIIGLTVIACGKGGGSPSDVARQFWTAAEKGDFKTMTNLMDPESAEIMAALSEKMERAAEEDEEGGMSDSIKEKGGLVKTEETIDGDTATVKLTFGDESTEDLKLVKTDGKWKVTLGK